VKNARLPTPGRSSIYKSIVCIDLEPEPIPSRADFLREFDILEIRCPKDQNGKTAAKALVINELPRFAKISSGSCPASHYSQKRPRRALLKLC
jgi:hypothetical protein